MKNGIPQISVQELKQRLDAGEDLFILDVRAALRVPDRQHRRQAHPHERSARRLAEIDRNREIVVHCKLGISSQRVAEFLAQSGYPNVKNLAGGIRAWADQIDPKVTKY